MIYFEYRVLRSVSVPNTACTRPLHEHQGRDGGTAASLRAHALRAVRQLVWLGVGSVTMTLSHPAHQPLSPLPPSSPLAGRCAGVLTQYPGKLRRGIPHS